MGGKRQVRQGRCKARRKRRQKGGVSTYKKPSKVWELNFTPIHSQRERNISILDLEHS